MEEAQTHQAEADSGRKWYTVQTRSNMERKAVEHLKRMIDREDMGEYISKDDILSPEEKVSTLVQVKRNGKVEQKQKQVTRMLYPGYIYLNIALRRPDGSLHNDAWYKIQAVDGVISFACGRNKEQFREQNEVTNKYNMNFFVFQGYLCIFWILSGM